MKIVVGVLTHNAIRFGRFSLLAQTVSSLRKAFPGSTIKILDNGSNDGTSAWVTRNGGIVYRPRDGNHTPGRGINVLVQRMLSELREEGLLVLSDDDMLWKQRAGEQLQKFWSKAPKDVAIVCGYLEPQWAWNTPRGVVESGGVRVLWRDSAPGAAWTFLRSRWSVIGPVPETWQFDTKTCEKLRGSGRKVAQIDLCEHKGWGKSTHGNTAISSAWPLDKKAWGLS